MLRRRVDYGEAMALLETTCQQARPFQGVTGRVVSLDWARRRVELDGGRVFALAESFELEPVPGTRYDVFAEGEEATMSGLRATGDGEGMTMAQLAVAWTLANPVITSPIVGASRAEQLNDALAAVATPMDATLKQRLDELTHEYRFGDESR